MTPRRSDGARTEQLILDAAAHVFADRGFHDAHVADICKRAGVNAASVNYYFGSKSKLYRDAWRYAFELSIAAHPPDGGVPKSAPPAERLRGRIYALVHRITDPASLEFDIGSKEMSTPTGLLSEIMDRSLEPLHNRLLAVIRELVGPDVSDDDATLCVMSVQGQCFGLLMPHRPRARGGEHAERASGPVYTRDADRVAEHVFRFSLAGINAVRNRT